MLRSLTVHSLRGPAYSLAFVPFSNQCGTSNPPPSRPSVLACTPPCVHPLRGSASLLTHRLVSSSHSICNNLNPPLADIVLFGLSLSGFPTETRLLGRMFHSPPQPTWDLTYFVPYPQLLSLYFPSYFNSYH